MKKILKPITKEKMKKIKNIDNLFTKDVISLDDTKNRKYLDDLVYQSYLVNSNNGSDGFDEWWNYYHISRSWQKFKITENKK